MFALAGDLDLVILGTPPHTHFDLAAAAIAHGLHVVVDKPFVTTTAHGEELITRASEAGVKLTVFQNRRWDADFLALKAEMASGRLGRVVTIETRYDRHRPEVKDRWREGPGGGVWLDLGPHLIDQMLVLFGRPQAITCDLAVQREGGLSPDWAYAILRYPDKRVVLNAAMVVAAPDVRFAVHGTRGSWLKSGLDVQEDQLKAGKAVGSDGWGVDPLPATFIDGGTFARTPASGPAGDYPAYYAGVAAALRGDGPNPVPPDQALAVMDILEAGLESHARRAEVQIPAYHS
jgi:predicted dehydrogenase